MEPCGSLLIRPGARQVFLDGGHGVLADPTTEPPPACPALPLSWSSDTGENLALESFLLEVSSDAECAVLTFVDTELTLCGLPPVPFAQGDLLQITLDDDHVQLYQASSGTRYVHGIGRSTLKTKVYGDTLTGEVCVLDTPCGPALPADVRVDVPTETIAGSWGQELQIANRERSYTVWHTWTGRPLDDDCSEAVQATLLDHPLP